MATRVSRRRPGVAVARRAAGWAKPATGRSPRGGYSVGGLRPGSGGRGATGRDGRTPGSTSGAGNTAADECTGGTGPEGDGGSGREADGATGCEGIRGTGCECRTPAAGTGG